MKKTNMHLSEDMLNKLKEYKKITGVPASEAIRQSLLEFFKRREKKW